MTTVKNLNPVQNTTSVEDDKKVVDEFVKNPENKKKAGEMAFQIKQDFPNWFKVSQLVKKYKVTTADVAKKLEMLMLFKMCVGKVTKGVGSFKIDLDQRVQRELILQEIAQKEGEILFLKEKLSTLD